MTSRSTNLWVAAAALAVAAIALPLAIVAVARSGDSGQSSSGTSSGMGSMGSSAVGYHTVRHRASTPARSNASVTASRKCGLHACHLIGRSSR
jgi:branched-subunit amino acid permease